MTISPTIPKNSLKFKNIGLIGKHTNPEVHSTVSSLVKFLNANNINIYLEEQLYLTAVKIYPNLPAKKVLSADEFGQVCDLIIVVGGDGSMLTVSRKLIEFQLPIIGVNRGHLGFLTDISPQALTQSLTPILKGNYNPEQRFLLKADFKNNAKQEPQIALNDIVLYSGHLAKMVEFEIYIDDKFVLKQRADGVIISSPTGSTAYALSGGGPIIHPSLEAILLVPMHPHILTSRPIVVSSSSKIKLKVTDYNKFNPRLSLDGQVHYDIKPGSEIIIEKYSKTLKLIHPKDYNFYHTLRSKLDWSA